MTELVKDVKINCQIADLIAMPVNTDEVNRVFNELEFKSLRERLLGNSNLSKTKSEKDQAKFINSRRRHKTDVAIARQVRIAKQHGWSEKDIRLKEQHRMAKHHTMDCGNPKCMLCGNPRKSHKDKLTAQEKRMYQDTDKRSDRHSNGLRPEDE